MNLNLNALVARLNPTCRHALERAAQQSHDQRHFYVEIEHLLAALLESDGSDVVCLLAPAGLDREKLGDEIRKTQEQFRRGNTRLPSFSAHLVLLLEGAVLQSAVSGQEHIRSAHLLHTLLVRDTLRSVLVNSIPSLLNIPLNHFEQHWKTGRHIPAKPSQTTPRLRRANHLGSDGGN